MGRDPVKVLGKLVRWSRAHVFFGCDLFFVSALGIVVILAGNTAAVC